MTMRTSHDKRIQLFDHIFHVTIKIVLWPASCVCAWYLPQIHSLSCVLSEGDLPPIASIFEFTVLGIPPRHETETVQHIVYPEGRMVGSVPSSFLDFGRSTEHDPGEPLHRQTSSSSTIIWVPSGTQTSSNVTNDLHEIFKGSSTCRSTREPTGVERSFPVDRVKRPSKLRHCMAARTGKVAGEKVPFRCLATEIVGRGKAENSGYGIRPWIGPLDVGSARKVSRKKGYPAARPVRLVREVPKEIRSLDRKCSRHRSTKD
ncbi:hypothetical protein BO83DRAFT_410480 [Aspergillus eucalypticola CBS 122712]|uniref:Uncharacterized protein n=1 Tax=Aspergillus eucalypticola (strain CBS 122712 / IBT 29274) TaxID=1448314 RepID=A0A317V0M8_ASPEC|nr:uncharacterized protein BO83DRAFT_410480 [Aspergillus eucalypticola CBS 122712]PWY66628.1 hypothetical protein BO83DRAFT_410480 [Aspergillus eucalypticola CBS 122712]